MNFLLYGAGGHASVLLDIARISGVNITAVLDDKPAAADFEGIPILLPGDLEQFVPFQFHIGVGDNNARAKLFLHLSERGTPANLVHPFSSVSAKAALGKGVAIMPGAIINTGAVIEDNTIINTAASLDHHCRIGPHSHICPGVRLAGNVTVGSLTMIGTGASIIPGVKIGRNCTVGAGSVVVRDVPDGATVFGVPARRALGPKKS
jgi:sugar O-acyltransferase (sialic acid O-acetyltransferase NeuD family)